MRIFTESGFLDPNKPIRDYTPKERKDFLHKEPVKVKIGNLNLTSEGLIPKRQKSFLSKDVETLQPHIRAFAEIGLGCLSLDRTTSTLSGGERQRLKLAMAKGADGGIDGLDEPTNGLHLTDLEQLLGLLDRLVDSGKSVIVIEHHLAVMAHDRLTTAAREHLALVAAEAKVLGHPHDQWPDRSLDGDALRHRRHRLDLDPHERVGGCVGRCERLTDRATAPPCERGRVDADTGGELGGGQAGGFEAGDGSLPPAPVVALPKRQWAGHGGS